MAPKPSVMKCPKCGFQPSAAGKTCAKCGTRLEKLCGECGFGNSLEKNYCDQCGSALTAPQPVGAPQGAAATAPQPQAQAPGASFHGKVSVGSPMIADSARLRQQTERKTPPARSLARRLAGPAVTVLLAGVLLSIIYMIAAPSLPKFRLQMAAKAYLSAISQGKFEKAYELLSTNSRAACSMDDYVKNNKEYYSSAPAWQFKDIQVYAMDRDAAVVRYQLKEGTAPWKADYISFVREHGRWTRPYIWILFQPIQDALDRHDFPQALFLSQKLYITDPVDPRTSGYLCSSEYMMKLYEKSADSCKRTVTAAANYPVGYNNDDLFWFSFYYADSLRMLQRTLVSIQEYEKLLKWPGVTQEEQGIVYLNRADAYVANKDYDNALQDVMRAESLCSGEPQKSDAKRKLRFMSGTAFDEAIDFAQKARYQGVQVGELRRQQLEQMKARVGNSSKLPKDRWFSVHVAGPEYRVFLRQQVYNPATRKIDSDDIFIFWVNLWSNTGKVEKAPGMPGPSLPKPEN